MLPPELVELVHEDPRLRVVPLPQPGVNSGAVADVQQGRPNARSHSEEEEGEGPCKKCLNL